jgi:hypothetical protein
MIGPGLDANPGQALGFAGLEVSSPVRFWRQPLATKIKRRHAAEIITLLRLWSTCLFMDPAF